MAKSEGVELTHKSGAKVSVSAEKADRLRGNRLFVQAKAPVKKSAAKATEDK